MNDAFGDFTRRFAKYREVLARARIYPLHVEPRRKHLNSPAERKNLADIVLTIAVTECVLTRQDVGHIVIISGDSDFIELAEWCRSHGRFVTGIAAGDVNDGWPSACDRFRQFSDLVGGVGPSPRHRRRSTIHGTAVGEIVREGGQRAVEGGRRAAVKGRAAAGKFLPTPDPGSRA